MNLSATLAQLIPSAAFLWFLLLSVPVGVMQSRLSKRFMLNIGMGVTALGLLVPYFFYTFEMVLVGFAMLGIGNTIVQVSANPLLVDVVPGNRTSSFLSFSQFVKAIGSMIGAPLAAILAAWFGDWKLLFLVFGVVSILSVLWLGSVKIDEKKLTEIKATFVSSFRLLGTGFVLMMVVSVEKYPTRSNEISGLMMMAISGGAVIPLIIGWVSDLSNVAIGMSILIVCMIYLLSVSVYSLKR
ncbi:MAG: MFS transporter [Bacteroidales bacterium]|nr:MFS transporter [Bacteroidales bacterium]